MTTKCVVLAITAHIGSSIKFMDIYGPWKIGEKIGEAAYKLDLSGGSLIHLVFLANRLKKCILDKDSMMDGNVE